MPKIIENARSLLINEAKRQIEENGYDSVTIRSIARGCGLGLGTFYNYFKSKNILIASFLLEDWQERITKINTKSETTTDPNTIVRYIYDELSEFIVNNKSIFTSTEAIKSFNGIGGAYHKVLRAQIAAPICKICDANGHENAAFLSEFVAESIITWTVAEKSYEEIASITNKLFVK